MGGRSHDTYVPPKKQLYRRGYPTYEVPFSSRCTTKSIAKKSPTCSLLPAVPLAITRTSRPWTHTPDDSYIHQLSLVVATATVSLRPPRNNWVEVAAVRHLRGAYTLRTTIYSITIRTCSDVEHSGVFLIHHSFHHCHLHQCQKSASARHHNTACLSLIKSALETHPLNHHVCAAVQQCVLQCCCLLRATSSYQVSFTRVPAVLWLIVYLVCNDLPFALLHPGTHCFEDSWRWKRCTSCFPNLDSPFPYLNY